jgi:FkbM family methyltransferase
MKLLSRFRKLIDTYFPLAGILYRSARDVGASRRSRQSGHGFRLAGAPEMARESFESDQVSAFLECIKSHDIVLDIGANIGFYSCLASSHGKHVLAFEPAERNLRFLLRNLWENEFRCVEVFPMGLGAEQGLCPIYGFGGISSFIPGWAQARKSRFSVVPVATLDRVIGTSFQNERLLIKMDVEGFEFEVLKGASEVLRKNPRPTWLIEIMLRNPLIPSGVNPRFRDTFELLWSNGYQCRRLDRCGSPVTKDDVTRWHTDGFVEGDTGNFLFN